MIRVAITILVLISAFLAGDAAAQSRAEWSPSVSFTAATSLELDEAPWGMGVSGELLRRKGRLAFGAELGYQSLGTQTTRIEDFDNQPGWLLTEDVTRSVIRVALLARYHLLEGGVRPYLVASAGAYNGRFRDRITVYDANGNRVPFYDFDGSGHDTKPAFSVGAGAILTRLGSGPRLGVEGRWHGIFDVTEDGLGTADFISIGITLRW